MMGVRRQIYLDEANERLLEEQSAATGLSVSELVRRAVQQCYGPGRRLTWDEVFAIKLQPSSPTHDHWSHDTLFDAEVIDAALREAGGER
jgi:hypothetical protein